jgi:hypothetical protein
MGRKTRLSSSVLNNCDGRPEYGVNTKFAHFVNEHDKVMTKDFAERFVDHRNVSLAAKAISELPWSRGKC